MMGDADLVDSWVVLDDADMLELILDTRDKHALSVFMAARPVRTGALTESLRDLDRLFIIIAGMLDVCLLLVER
jgi:hypothetical protein